MRRLLSFSPDSPGQKALGNPRSKNRLRKLSACALLGLSTSLSALAGDVLWNFDTDPLSDPQFTGSVFAGNQATSFWYPFNGNPDTGGYMAITDAVGSQNLVAIFPVVDTFLDPDDGQTKPTPLKAWQVDMDLRVGNGNERPADGFSISFARLNDPVIYWASQTPPVASGTAGGDSEAAANVPASNPAACTSGNFENGTKTGVSIAFDTWEGNWLPRTGVSTNLNGAGTTDVEGIAVRVDDITLLQRAISTRNGACTDTNSMQTGPWDNSFSINGLCWQPLSILWTNNRLTVTYKGAKLLEDYDLSSVLSPPMSGRLLLMGRTGGNNENTHVDNIRITTTPAQEASLQSLVGSFDSFTFTLKDLGASQVATVTKVLLDDTNDVTSTTVVTKSGTVTTGTYTAPAWFASRSGHKVYVEFQTTLGQTLTGVANFTVPNWTVLPTGLALAQSSVSGQGFTGNAVVTKAINPNTLRFSEEQVVGLHGYNFANGAVTYSGVVNFGNTVNGTGGAFTNNAQFEAVGIPTQTSDGTINVVDNATLELFAYVYFPTSGLYKSYLGSDDGFLLTYAKNAKDRMGTEIYSFNGGRGIGVPGDLIYIKVDAAGAYPMRLLWQNGNGGTGNGANLEWYFEIGGTNVLVNDTSVSGAVLAYQNATGAGPYVKSANPVRDGQNVIFYQPIIIELGDGTGTMAVNPATVALKVDGNDITTSAVKTGDTTLVKQTSAANWAAGAHTILLTFKDQAGADYSYTWNFSVFNLSTYPIVQIPATNAVQLSAIDTTKPGSLIRPWQSTGQPNTVVWTEEQFQGLHGANTAFPGIDLAGSHVWDSPMDFSGAGGQGLSGAEWIFDADQQYGGANVPPDNFSMDVSTWINFTTPGTYAMVVNSDDGFRLTSPYGNPMNRAGGVILGQFNGGRGTTGAPGNGGAGPRGGLDYMVFNIPSAGVYPFRLLWFNGGGGSGFEWSIYQFTPNGGVAQVLIGDTNQAFALKTYQRTLSIPPSIDTYPVHGGTVPATTPITITLTDYTTAVVGSSIVLKVNGVTYSPTVTSSAGVTTIVQNPPPELWLNGLNTVELTFNDGTGARTQTWTFTAQYLTLTGGFPLGSEDTAKPGFEWRVVQSAIGAIGPNDLADEQLLAGMWTNSLATAPTTTIPGYINWSSDLSAQGNFSSTAAAPMNIADEAVPGLAAGNTDNYAGEFLTYLVIPQAGLYQLGVNSDDGFKFTPTHARPVSINAVWVDNVAALPRPLLSTESDPATAVRLTAPIVGKFVAADPILAGTPLNNAADIRGNIAVCRRGTYNFSTKIATCAAAGAIAVVVVNNQAGDITMGATTPPGLQPIPAVAVRQEEGDALIAALAAGPVYGTVAGAQSQQGSFGALFDGGRGASDTLFYVKALAPGVYPVRLFFYEGGGGDNVEFFNVDTATGTRTLINEASSPIKAFRALRAGITPSLSISGPDAQGNVTITWTGTLEYAATPAGQWRGVGAAASPMTVPAAQARFYRATVFNAQ